MKRPPYSRPWLVPALLAGLLTGLLTGTPAQAVATTTTTLTNAVQVALPIDPSVKTAQANLTQAQAANQAAQNDPSTLVAAKLSASNGVTQAQANLKAAQLSSLQTTVQDYTSLLEAQENVELQTFQVQVYSKSLQVAQVKLGTGNATALDVQNAQNTLSGGQQNLTAAQASLNLASGKLATQMGISGPVRAAGAPNFPKLASSLAALQGNLGTLNSLVTAGNALTVAQLNVKLANNDFTPAQTLQQAQTALANAQRNLTSTQQSAAQALATAYQNALNTTELLGVAQNKEAAALKQYNQDTARLKSGTIAATDVLTSQLALKQAQFARLKAQDDVLVSLAALSVASGKNLTGVGGI